MSAATDSSYAQPWPPPPGPGALLLELEFGSVGPDSDIRYRAEVTPATLLPGTGRLRTSILATLLDVILGNEAAANEYPHAALTASLDVHLHRPPPRSGTIEIVGRPVRMGRSLMVLEAEISYEGHPIGIGGATFVAVPHLGIVSEERPPRGTPAGGPRLSMPLAERAGVEVVEPGLARLPDQPGTRNGAGTIAGGLLALVAEEAALSLTPGATLSTFSLKFLKPVTVGPAMARAELRDALGRVEVRDVGSADNHLAVLATTRSVAW